MFQTYHNLTLKSIRISTWFSSKKPYLKHQMFCTDIFYYLYFTEVLKDFGKLIGVLLGIAIVLGVFSWIFGGGNNSNTLKYHLYEYEQAENECESTFSN